MVRRLTDCNPKWLERGRDWACGIQWVCWVHGPLCTPMLFFRNPAAGFQPIRQDATGYPPLVWRIGSGFGTLTVAEHLNLGECFRGYLVEGEFHPSH